MGAERNIALTALAEIALRDVLLARLGARVTAEDLGAAVAESVLLAREIEALRPLLGPADAPDAFAGMMASP
jgi:hypothetical protein